MIHNTSTHNGRGTETIQDPLLQGDVEDGVVSDGKQGEERGASIFSSVLNLANTILGSGCLAMPYVCRTTGIGTFLILLFGVGYVSSIALNMLIDVTAALKLPKARYPAIGRVTCGRAGTVAAQWSVVLQQIGACTAYVVIVADVLQPVLLQFACGGTMKSAWCGAVPMQVIVVVCIIFPLCLLKTMKALVYASVASMGCIFCLIGYVTFLGIFTIADPSKRSIFLTPDNLKTVGEVTWFKSVSAVELLSCFPIIAFAFLCHQNVFPIYRELHQPSPKRMTKVTASAILTAITAYSFVGIGGYLVFLEHTNQDLLKSFGVAIGSGSDAVFLVLVDILRVGFGISIILSYPLIIWEAREGIMEMIGWNHNTITEKKRIFLNAVIIGATATLGINIPSITSVLGVVGSTCSPTMMFILPPLFYYRAVVQGVGTEEGLKDSRGCGRGKCVSLTMLTFGVIMVPVALGATIYGLVHPS